MVSHIKEAEKGGAALHSKPQEGYTCTAVMLHNIHQFDK